MSCVFFFELEFINLPVPTITQINSSSEEDDGLERSSAPPAERRELMEDSWEEIERRANAENEQIMRELEPQSEDSSDACPYCKTISCNCPSSSDSEADEKSSNGAEGGIRLSSRQLKIDQHIAKISSVNENADFAGECSMRPRVLVEEINTSAEASKRGSSSCEAKTGEITENEESAQADDSAKILIQEVEKIENIITESATSAENSTPKIIKKLVEEIEELEAPRMFETKTIYKDSIEATSENVEVANTETVSAKDTIENDKVEITSLMSNLQIDDTEVTSSTLPRDYPEDESEVSGHAVQHEMQEVDYSKSEEHIVTDNVLLRHMKCSVISDDVRDLNYGRKLLIQEITQERIGDGVKKSNSILLDGGIESKSIFERICMFEEKDKNATADFKKSVKNSKNHKTSQKVTELIPKVKLIEEIVAPEEQNVSVAVSSNLPSSIEVEIKPTSQNTESAEVVDKDVTQTDILTELWYDDIIDDMEGYSNGASTLIANKVQPVIESSKESNCDGNFQIGFASLVDFEKQPLMSTTVNVSATARFVYPKMCLHDLERKQPHLSMENTYRLPEQILQGFVCRKTDETECVASWRGNCDCKNTAVECETNLHMPSQMTNVGTSTDDTLDETSGKPDSAAFEETNVTKTSSNIKLATAPSISFVMTEQMNISTIAKVEIAKVDSPMLKQMHLAETFTILNPKGESILLEHPDSAASFTMPDHNTPEILDKKYANTCKRRVETKACNYRLTSIDEIDEIVNIDVTSNVQSIRSANIFAAVRSLGEVNQDHLRGSTDNTSIIHNDDIRLQKANCELFHPNDNESEIRSEVAEGGIQDSNTTMTGCSAMIAQHPVINLSYDPSQFDSEAIANSFEDTKSALSKDSIEEFSLIGQFDENSPERAIVDFTFLNEIEAEIDANITSNKSESAIILESIAFTEDLSMLAQYDDNSINSTTSEWTYIDDGEQDKGKQSVSPDVNNSIKSYVDETVFESDLRSIRTIDLPSTSSYHNFGEIIGTEEYYTALHNWSCGDAPVNTTANISMNTDLGINSNDSSDTTVLSDGTLVQTSPEPLIQEQKICPASSADSYSEGDSMGQAEIKNFERINSLFDNLKTKDTPAVDLQQPTNFTYSLVVQEERNRNYIQDLLVRRSYDRKLAEREEREENKEILRKMRKIQPVVFDDNETEEPEEVEEKTDTINILETNLQTYDDFVKDYSTFLETAMKPRGPPAYHKQTEEEPKRMIYSGVINTIMNENNFDNLEPRKVAAEADIDAESKVLKGKIETFIHRLQTDNDVLEEQLNSLGEKCALNDAKVDSAHRSLENISMDIASGVRDTRSAFEELNHTKIDVDWFKKLSQESDQQVLAEEEMSEAEEEPKDPYRFNDDQNSIINNEKFKKIIADIDESLHNDITNILIDAQIDFNLIEEMEKEDEEIDLEKLDCYRKQLKDSISEEKRNEYDTENKYWKNFTGNIEEFKENVDLEKHPAIIALNNLMNEMNAGKPVEIDTEPDVDIIKEMCETQNYPCMKEARQAWTAFDRQRNEIERNMSETLPFVTTKEGEQNEEQFFDCCDSESAPIEATDDINEPSTSQTITCSDASDVPEYVRRTDEVWKSIEKSHLGNMQSVIEQQFEVLENELKKTFEMERVGQSNDTTGTSIDDAAVEEMDAESRFEEELRN